MDMRTMSTIEVKETLSGVQIGESREVKFKQVISTYSSEKQYDKAILEWFIYDMRGSTSNDTMTCICSNSSLKTVYFIKNQKTNHILRVGRNCIKKLGGNELEKQLNVIKSNKVKTSDFAPKKSCQRCQLKKISEDRNQEYCNDCIYFETLELEYEINNEITLNQITTNKIYKRFEGFRPGCLHKKYIRGLFFTHHQHALFKNVANMYGGSYDVNWCANTIFLVIKPIHKEVLQNFQMKHGNVNHICG